VRRGLLIAAAALALVGCAGDDGEREFHVGVVEDSTRQPDPAAARERVQSVVDAGFNAIRVTSIWAPGQAEPAAAELDVLRNVATASEELDVRLFIAVYHAGSATTPRTDQERADFASYVAAIARELPVRDFIIGNEPNLNRFWMPQFGPNGEDVAASEYGLLLAECYDALKAVSEDVNVIGGALAPRGSDRPELPRDTHSPTAFLRDLGAAYRQSGREEPLMDILAYHPYETNSSVPPGNPHPESTTMTLGDYDRLVALLGEAFEGTAQEGEDLPILYTEFGVESRIPEEKADLYEGEEFDSVKPVDEQTQADHYTKAIRLSYCQETVIGILLFHVFDELDLSGWQSGVRYVDDTPKESYDAVKRAAEEAHAGDVECEAD
jgi:Cellulase (glycosyl hydrolase family 5)